MKILMQNRRDTFSVPGGDTIQMSKTKENLEKRYNIRIDFSNELTPNLDDYDIVHLFNVTRVHETYVQFINAKKQNKPVILTPIYHSLKHIKLYEESGRIGTIRTVNKILKNQTLREFTKNIIRSLRDYKQIYPTFIQLLRGYIEQQRYVLENADLILVIAEKEFFTLKEELGITHNRYMVVPNGFDLDDSNNNNFDGNSTLDIPDKYILCAGRIENRKNQIGLIKALKNTNLKVVFVGGVNPKQNFYFKQFNELIDDKQFFYVGKVKHEEMSYLFKNAQVHVLPSWFEVVPLVDIEACLLGCKVVTTKNSYISEYLRDNAFYCDPTSEHSIINTINKAILDNNKNNNEQNLNDYKWENVIENCYIGYQKLSGLK